MHWFFIALGAPFLWAIVNVADQYLISNYSDQEKERSSGGLVIFSSVIGLFISGIIAIFISGIFDISLLDKGLLLITGLFTVVWIVLYLYALELEEISLVVPWFLTVPVLGYILGYFFLGEKLSSGEILGSGIIFIGLILLSLNFSGEKKGFKKKLILYMFCACIVIAVSGVIFKYVTIEGDFWVSSFWEYLGLGITGLFLYFFVPKHREEFKNMNRMGGKKIFVVNTVSELMSVLGNLLSNFALLLAPVAMVFLVGSFQPVMVLFFTILGTKFFPHIVKENISKQILLPKIVAIGFMTFGSVILFL